jgi:hypothetical protein
VLRENYRHAEIAVDFADGREELRGRDWVQLARRLVKYQRGGLHRHNGGEGEQLLLPAGELRDRFSEPCLYAEETRDLGHAQAYFRRFEAERLKPERQLVPHFVRHNLIFRRLEDEADFCRRVARRHFG